MELVSNVAPATRRSLYVLSWGIVFYTVLIILWGAWVRISGSGAGCGDHWPLCNGEVVPSSRGGKTWVEYSHRLSTAVYGVLVLLQVITTRRMFPCGYSARFWSGAVVFFTITEALLGANLVLLRLVEESRDLLRMVVMPLHLVNTSLLLLSTVMTAEGIRYGELPRRSLTKGTRTLLAALVVLVTVMLTTGAIAALGAHLAPSISLFEGLSTDLSISSHPAVRTRILHPLLGAMVPIAMVGIALKLRAGANPRSAWWYSGMAISLCVALVVGVLTLLFLSPVPLKVMHLLMANVVVIFLSGGLFHSVRSSDEVTKS